MFGKNSDRGASWEVKVSLTSCGLDCLTPPWIRTSSAVCEALQDPPLRSFPGMWPTSQIGMRACMMPSTYITTSFKWWRIISVFISRRSASSRSGRLREFKNKALTLLDHEAPG